MHSTTKRTLSIGAIIALLLTLALTTTAQTVTTDSAAAAQTQTSAQSGTASAISTRPSAGCGTDQTPGNDERTITSAGGERTYRINVPRDYDPQAPQPLVLGFHGNGSDGAEFQNYTGLPQLPAVTVFPDGALKDGKRSWQGAPYASGADDVRFVSDLLDSIEDDFCIDLNRVYATGKSNGGGMVSVLACQLRERFSAFATVAGAYYPQSTEGCDYSEPTPMLAIHGTGDETMHYDGGTRQGEDYPGVREWIQPWAEASDCQVKTERNVGKKGEDVLRTRWKKCTGNSAEGQQGSDRQPGADVELYSVAGGGHVWPGEAVYSGGGYVTKHFSATTTLWKFFQDHPRSDR